MARATLLSSSQLGSYDALKGACKRWLGAAEGVALHLSCSLMSGIIAQTVIQPVDTCAPPPSSAFFPIREDLFASCC